MKRNIVEPNKDGWWRVTGESVLSTRKKKFYLKKSSIRLNFIYVRYNIYMAKKHKLQYIYIMKCKRREL